MTSAVKSVVVACVVSVLTIIQLQNEILDLQKKDSNGTTKSQVEG